MKTTKMTFFLLISCTVIDILACEVIEVRGPTETRRLNSSAILDKAILRTDTDDPKYTSGSKDSLNLTFIPWPITRILREKSKSPNFRDSVDTQARVSKSLHTSAHLPPRRTLERRQIIPAGQSMYPSWNEMSLKLNSTTLDNKKFNKEEIYENAPDDKEEKSVPLVFSKNVRHREERRKDVGINRQFSAYDENIHDPDEAYETPEKYFSASSYEPGNGATYSQKYVSQNGRYGLENYNSYATENYKNNRYYDNSEDHYFGNAERWPPRHPHTNLGFSRFSVDSFDDPARGVPAPSLIAIFSAIGSNLLQLFKIGLGSGLSIAIPIIAIKLFLIPLKILKFIKVIKILLKLFFVVPFILRTFAPSIYSAIGYHDIGFTNKMDSLPTLESRDVVDQTNEHPTWWNSLAMNLTSTLPDFVSGQKCPNKVACELGSYLASRSTIPEKLTRFLANTTLEESKSFEKERNEKEEITRAFLRALTQRWTYDQCDVFVCGISF